jgi:hypothetical protein
LAAGGIGTAVCTTASTIGFIGPSTAVADATRRAALKQRLAELGWVEGCTMAIEYRWAEGSVPRAGKIAAESVRQVSTSSLSAVMPRFVPWRKPRQRSRS